MSTVRPLLLAALALLSVSHAGCANESQRRVHDDLRKKYDAWYQQAWGQPMASKETESYERRFDCMWRELTRANEDAERDLRCLGLRLEAQTRCFRLHASADAADTVKECGRSLVSSTCSVSAAFDRIAETTCREDSGFRL